MVGDSRWGREAEDAYDSIAPFYDEFTSHHDYERWVEEMLPAFEANGLTGNRLLDVACGTGKSFLPMLDRGWSVTGCDISAEMVAVAEAKVGSEVVLRTADMRDLPDLGEFDLIWALGEAVNYLLEPRELVAAFSGMKRNLAPTGRVVFEANTVHTYRAFFAEEEVVERDEYRLIWRGRTPPDVEPGSFAEATFEVEPRDPARPRVGPDTFRERHYLRAEFEAALEQAGLRTLAVYGHHHDAVPRQPLDEDSHVKSVFVAAAA
jgi:SAM-dependent methyltransferase